MAIPKRKMRPFRSGITLERYEFRILADAKHALTKVNAERSSSSARRATRCAARRVVCAWHALLGSTSVCTLGMPSPFRRTSGIWSDKKSNTSTARSTTSSEATRSEAVEWTAASWLNANQKVGDALAQVMLAAGRTDSRQSELDIVRGLGSMANGRERGGPAQLAEMLRRGGALEALAAQLWPEIEALASAAPSPAPESSDSSKRSSNSPGQLQTGPTVEWANPPAALAEMPAPAADVGELEVRDALVALDARVRKSTLEAVGLLEPAELVSHADAVVARLADSDWSVRAAAVATLGKLQKEVLARHTSAVICMLDDTHWEVRHASVGCLGMLETDVLTSHHADIAKRLGHSDWHVRWASVQLLGKLDAAALATHAQEVAAKLDDADGNVRWAARATLDKLDKQQLDGATRQMLAKLAS